MSLVILAAAAGLSSANPSSLLRPGDYPLWALQKDKSAAAVLEITLDQNGKVMSCTRQEFFGDEKLADALCRIVASRKTEPAIRADGSKAFYKARTFMTMFLPHTTVGDQVAKVRQGADITVSLPSLPSGLTDPMSTVTVDVDDKGRVTDCKEAEPKPGQILVGDACSHAKGVSLPPLKLPDGRMVPYVSTMKILFKAAG